MIGQHQTSLFGDTQVATPDEELPSAFTKAEVSLFCDAIVWWTQEKMARLGFTGSASSELDVKGLKAACLRMVGMIELNRQWMIEDALGKLVGIHKDRARSYIETADQALSDKSPYDKAFSKQHAAKFRAMAGSARKEADALIELVRRLRTEGLPSDVASFMPSTIRNVAELHGGQS